MSGASGLVYWVSTFLFDATLWALLTGLFLTVFGMYGTGIAAAFLNPIEAAASTATLTLLYGLAALPQGYLYSFAFDSPAAAQIAITSANFITGFVAIMAIQIMGSIPKTAELADDLLPLFRCFPQYLLGEAYLNMSILYAENSILGTSTHVFAWHIAGRSIVLLLIQSVCYFTGVLLLELDIFSYLLAARRARLSLETSHLRSALQTARASTRTSPQGGARAGGLSAMNRSGDDDDVVVRVVGLHKVYLPPLALVGARKHAVRGVSFEVRRGEVFGFLGVNGAGKSTTLGVLTNDVARTRRARASSQARRSTTRAVRAARSATARRPTRFSNS